nr:hypothetical protein WG33_0211 [uncultured bacterium]
MSAASLPFPSEPRIDSRIPDDLTRYLQVAAIVADPRKRLRATQQAYAMAMTRCRAALDALGYFKAHVTMRECWDDAAFCEMVEHELGRFAQGLDDCTVIVEFIDFKPGDDSFIPLRPRGRANVTVGQRDGHDGFDAVSREIGWKADGEVFEVNGRKIGVFSIAVDD